MTSLLSRLVRRKPPASSLAVTVYSRQQCGCCHQALELLERYRRLLGFTIEVIDVDTDPALAAQHGETVPVVAIDGKIRFRGKVNPVLLERLIKADPQEG